MASGIKQNFGTMAKPIQVGHAAQKGLLAALLAEEGATASYEALEGKQGFFAVYNGGGHYDEGSIEGLGQSWELLTSGLMFKKYACCGSTHPVIDAGIELSLRDNIDPARIDAVRVAINPRRIPHVNRPKVTDALGAKFSVQYTAAAALVDRTVGLRHFFDAVVNRADLQRVAERVEVVGLERVGGDLSQACEITVTSDEGQIHSIRLEQAKGRKAEEYEHFKRAKFLDCASRLLAPTAAERLLTRLEGFESEAAVGEVMREMSAPRAPSRTKVEA
jgi:2-methylcitrate dehydratase PrpD